MAEIRDCKVMVVGGAGFLGSHLVNHLIEDRNCEVSVLDNLASGRREFIHKDANFWHYDITHDERGLHQILNQLKPEYVFNYAACPYIPVSFDRPLYVSNVNAFGAMKLINACHESGVKGVLQVSSAEIYGGSGYSPNPNQKINEFHPVQPHSTYGASKAMVDFYVQARWREAKVKCIALRQFNCLGERETHPYVITEIMSQLAKPIKEYKILLGNNATRDFMYAGDAVRYAVSILESERWGEVFNLGSEASISVYELASVTSILTGHGKVLIETDVARMRPWEIWHLQSDNSKVRNATKDRFNTCLEEAIGKTWRYYQSNGYKWCWEE